MCVGRWLVSGWDLGYDCWFWHMRLFDGHVLCVFWFWTKHTLVVLGGVFRGRIDIVAREEVLVWAFVTQRRGLRSHVVSFYDTIWFCNGEISLLFYRDVLCIVFFSLRHFELMWAHTQSVALLIWLQVIVKIRSTLLIHCCVSKAVRDVGWFRPLNLAFTSSTLQVWIVRVRRIRPLFFHSYLVFHGEPLELLFLLNVFVQKPLLSSFIVDVPE